MGKADLNLEKLIEIIGFNRKGGDLKVL
jgi:hypothetical protein